MEAEGFTAVHDEARNLLMYIFFGQFITKSGCKADIIRVIHKSIQQYTYRYRWNDINSSYLNI